MFWCLVSLFFASTILFFPKSEGHVTETRFLSGANLRKVRVLKMEQTKRLESELFLDLLITCFNFSLSLFSFQSQLELDKYLPQVNNPLLSLPTDSGDKKYRRESASVVDEYFSEDKPTTPYSLNINVILPGTTHLRTGLYRPNTKTLTPLQIKTEPELEVPCSVPTTQALPDFISAFNVPPVVHNVFIKPEMGAGGVGSVPTVSQQQQQQQQPNLDTELEIGPPGPQQQVYHMPITSSADLTMTLSHNSPSAHGSSSNRTMLNLGVGLVPTPSGNYMIGDQQSYYQASPTSSSQHTAPHSLPPSPPNSQPGSPDRQAELLSLASQPPPPYQQLVEGIKLTGLSPHALLMTHGQGVLTGPKYNRRNNPELEKRRIHFCNYEGMLVSLFLKSISQQNIRVKGRFLREDLASFHRFY